MQILHCRPQEVDELHSLAAHALARPISKFPFASVAREAGRALELCARLVHTAELLEEIAAHARQEVVVFE